MRPDLRQAKAWETPTLYDLSGQFTIGVILVPCLVCFIKKQTDYFRFLKMCSSDYTWSIVSLNPTLQEKLNLISPGYWPCAWRRPPHKGTKTLVVNPSPETYVSCPFGNCKSTNDCFMCRVSITIYAEEGFVRLKTLTQAKGLRQIIDIISHLLCFDHKAGQSECIPFWKEVTI